VENSEWNIKVTYPRDLELAELILKSRRGTTAR
jgi:2-C-methyl-D-erythritol 4-phosphate cytidylyltransferase